jgi:phage terminase large subunit
MSRRGAPRGLGVGLNLAASWSLSPVQWAFVSCEKRFSFYVGGVGGGKTYAGAVRAIVRALDSPGSLGLVGAPTYPMLRDATQRTLLELLPAPYVASYNKAEGHLRLRNGSELLFRSLDAPDRVRGLNLAWFWLDEAPLCGYYAWQVLKGRLRQRGFATAGWATGTPHGRDGFARDFELERRRNHALFRASTYANAHNCRRSTSRSWATAAPSTIRRCWGCSPPSRGWSTPSTPAPAGMSESREL